MCTIIFATIVQLLSPVNYHVFTYLHLYNFKILKHKLNLPYRVKTKSCNSSILKKLHGIGVFYTIRHLCVTEKHKAVDNYQIKLIQNLMKVIILHTTLYIGGRKNKYIL